MGATLVRTGNLIEEIVDFMVRKGLFRTKSEAFRQGILELASKYKVLDKFEEELVARKLKQIDKEIKEGKRKVYTLEELEKEFPELGELR